MIGINNKILLWAREKAGCKPEEAANLLRKDVSVILSWESGESQPTYSQLEKLAYKLYKRPIAVFFFPEPPIAEPNPNQEFRTLPNTEIINLSNDTLFAIRQAKAMQLSLLELNDGKNPAQDKIFIDIQTDINNNIEELARYVRKYLGVDLNNQLNWKNNIQALKEWRNVLQDKGIFIFKRSFKQTDVFGFCLMHKVFPVIYLNNSTAISRQIFSLFHELAHILLHTSGITKEDLSYFGQLRGKEKRIEVFCNKFAGEFLVPASDLLQVIVKGQEHYSDDYLSDIAKRYHVSRDVILRKLLDYKFVDEVFYNKKTYKWNQEYKNSQQHKKTKIGGGNFYAAQAAYLGEKYLNLVFSKYYQGKFSVQQLADYLNIKTKGISELEHFCMGRTKTL